MSAINLSTAIDRVHRRLEMDTHREGECIIWDGAKNFYGYGLIEIDGYQRQIHRIAYQLAYGSIPDGMVLDHLCRRPLCVNPDHLEPVTIAENLRRGHHVNREKTHCKHGHPLAGTNLRIVARSDGGTQRVCVECRRRISREWAAKNYRRAHHGIRGCK